MPDMAAVKLIILPR